MNQDAIRDAYKLFAENGYKGDINQFYDLLNENEDAVNDAHSIFVKNGYKGDVNQFSDLLGIKKKKPEPSKTSTLLSSLGLGFVKYVSREFIFFFLFVEITFKPSLIVI